MVDAPNAVNGWNVAISALTLMTVVAGYAFQIFLIKNNTKTTEAATNAAAKVAEVASANASHAADKVAQVAKNVAAMKVEVAEVKATGDKVHTLVNSQLGVALKATAESTRALANLTKDPADIAKAVEAEALNDRHIEQQEKVDAGKVD